jgi:hypothetical protein
VYAYPALARQAIPADVHAAVEPAAGEVVHRKRVTAVEEREVVLGLERDGSAPRLTAVCRDVDEDSARGAHVVEGEVGRIDAVVRPKFDPRVRGALEGASVMLRQTRGGNVRPGLAPVRRRREGDVTRAAGRPSILLEEPDQIEPIRRIDVDPRLRFRIDERTARLAQFPRRECVRKSTVVGNAEERAERRGSHTRCGASAVDARDAGREDGGAHVLSPLLSVPRTVQEAES